MFSASVEVSGEWINKQVSLANNQGTEFIAKGKSFMQIKNNSGPKFLPWGTPNGFITVSERLFW